MALATDRQTRSRNDRPSIQWPVAASTTIYGGALVMVDSSGYAVAADPESGTAGSIGVIGVAARRTVNSGAAGAINVELLQGEFFFGQSGFAQSDCAKIVYATDDETLEDDSASAGTEPQIAGVLLRVETDGAWVDINLANTVSLASTGSSSATYIDLQFTAGEDMTGFQGSFVYLTDTETVSLTGQTTQKAIGVLQNNPDVDETANVRVYGKSILSVSEAVAVGERIHPSGDTTGAGAPWDGESEVYVVGLVTTGGAETCTLLLTHEGLVGDYVEA